MPAEIGFTELNVPDAGLNRLIGANNGARYRPEKIELSGKTRTVRWFADGSANRDQGGSPRRDYGLKRIFVVAAGDHIQAFRHLKQFVVGGFVARFRRGEFDAVPGHVGE